MRKEFMEERLMGRKKKRTFESMGLAFPDGSWTWLFCHFRYPVVLRECGQCSAIDGLRGLKL